MEEIDAETRLLPFALASKCEIDSIYNKLQGFPGPISNMHVEEHCKEELAKRKREITRKIKVLEAQIDRKRKVLK